MWVMLPSLRNPSTLHSSLHPQITIQSIHRRKLLHTTLTLKRLEITVQLLMSVSIMSSSKPFPTSRPMRLYGSAFLQNANANVLCDY